ncbi:MAG: GFA family protein [Candidatus Puniceispirillaceae bacterium]|jgi:hypothetical protein
MTKCKEVLSTAGQIFHGRCHCGAVTFSVTGPLRQILACHCDDCRRLAGASWAATAAARDSYRFTSDASLTWYRSSAQAQRGFCNQCGSNLFYQRDDEDMMSVSTGMLDNTDDLTVEGQLFARSHPKWGPLPTTTLDLDDALSGRFDAS